MISEQVERISCYRLRNGVYSICGDEFIMTRYGEQRRLKLSDGDKEYSTFLPKGLKLSRWDQIGKELEKQDIPNTTHLHPQFDTTYTVNVRDHCNTPKIGDIPFRPFLFRKPIVES